MKISIFSFAVNDKFPLDILHRQFKKYMKEEYEFILFNDADDPKMEAAINLITSFNNINCVRVPQNIHKINNPSACYATTLNWAIHDYAVQNNSDVVVLIHSDIFPICDTLMSEILGNYTVASTTEFRKIGDTGFTYFYPAFTIVNMTKLKKVGVNELDFGLAPGFDTGGKTKDFIAKYPDAVKFLPNHQADYMRAILQGQPIADYFEEDIKICRTHGLSAGWCASGLYHYMAGSQWNAGNPVFAEGHKRRMDLFLKYFY